MKSPMAILWLYFILWVMITVQMIHASKNVMNKKVNVHMVGGALCLMYRPEKGWHADTRTCLTKGQPQIYTVLNPEVIKLVPDDVLPKLDFFITSWPGGYKKTSEGIILEASHQNEH